MTSASGKKELARAYLITGSDGDKVMEAARRLRRRVATDAGTDIDIDIFDAGEAGGAEVVAAANTMPFGGGVRLVMVYDVGQWRKDDKDLVAQHLEEPSPQCCLALVGSGLRRNEALYKAVAAAGEVLVFDTPRPADMPAWVARQARRRGMKMGAPEARRLVAACGGDQRAIASELDKLAAYTGGGAVKAEDIESVCWVSAETKIWDLTDAIGARDRRLAFRRLEDLAGDRRGAASAFYAVMSHLKRLYVVTEARERGEDPVAAASALGIKPYPARKIASQSAAFDSGGLLQALARLAELDADLKGRSDRRPDLALEMAMAEIFDVLEA